VVSMPELEAFNLVMVALSACALESCDASPMWLLPPRPSALARASAFAERAASAIGRPRRCARRCSRRFARDDRTARYPRGYSGRHFVDGLSTSRSVLRLTFSSPPRFVHDDFAIEFRAAAAVCSRPSSRLTLASSPRFVHDRLRD
jgi:hypothetical protein